MLRLLDSNANIQYNDDEKKKNLTIFVDLMMKNVFFVYTVTQSNASNTKQTGTSNIYHYGWFSVSNFHSIFERICYALDEL